MPDALGNYTPAETAAELGVNVSTLRNYVLRGELPEPGWVRVGRKRQRSYPKDWIDNAKLVLKGGE